MITSARVRVAVRRRLLIAPECHATGPPCDIAGFARRGPVPRCLLRFTIEAADWGTCGKLLIAPICRPHIDLDQ